MKTVGLLNTSTDSSNKGDLIITNSVRSVLAQNSIFINYEVPTHRLWNQEELSFASKVDIWVLAGTNLLNGHHFFHKKRFQWALNPDQEKILRGKVVGMGIGWWNYQRSTDFLTAQMYKKIFVNDFPHSIRDEYSKNKFVELGLNGVNTSCPTMWNMPEKLTATEDGVITTLTDYRKSPSYDKKNLRAIQDRFKNVYYFPQGEKDLAYFNSLGISGCHILKTWSDFEAICNEGYGHVGTRLHAGLYAMQLGRKSFFLATDNRVVEISKDTNLPMSPRDEFNEIHSIFQNQQIEIDVPKETINLFVDELARLISE